MATSVAFATSHRVVSEKLTLCRPADLPDPKEVYARVARRAYELFEDRGCNSGHEWQDWFQAESELLRPVPIEIAEERDKIIVRASVLGFDAAELKAAVEPLLLTIRHKRNHCGAWGKEPLRRLDSRRDFSRSFSPLRGAP